MRQKLLTFLALMLFALGVQTVRAEEPHMRLEMVSGEEQSFAVSLIGKITFTGKTMNLYDDAGLLLGSTHVDLIDKILFHGMHEGHEAIEETSVPAIQVFPNPTTESLFIRGVDGQQTVRIFNMQGRLMQSAVSADGEANLHVGGLQNGTYLLQIGAQVVKFIKE